MKISTKGRYAMRLMLDIAQYSKGGNVSLKDVSSRQDISLKYLEQIVNMLSKAGLVRAQRGAQGGYKLGKKADDITVGDILRVTEGNMAPVSCLESAENTCPHASECLTLPFWQGLYSTINNYLDAATLSDLLTNKGNNGIDMSLYLNQF